MATGLIAGPDNPPVLPLSFGNKVSISITIPNKVLITLNPSAPAFTTDFAISVISVTSGESFAKSGILAETFLRTLFITSAAAYGSHANT